MYLQRLQLKMWKIYLVLIFSPKLSVSNLSSQWRHPEFLTTRSFCLGVIVLTLLIIMVVIIPFLSFWNPKKLESSKIFGILQNHVRTCQFILTHVILYHFISFCIISYHFVSFQIILYHFIPFIISIKCGNYPNYLESI